MGARSPLWRAERGSQLSGCGDGPGSRKGQINQEHAWAPPPTRSPFPWVGPRQPCQAHVLWCSPLIPPTTFALICLSAPASFLSEGFCSLSFLAWLLTRPWELQAPEEAKGQSWVPPWSWAELAEPKCIPLPPLQAPLCQDGAPGPLQPAPPNSSLPSPQSQPHPLPAPPEQRAGLKTDINVQISTTRLGPDCHLEFAY